VKSIAFYPPLAPAAHLRAAAQGMPYPLDEPRCVLFSRGRHAIWHALRVLGLKPGDRVLAPAWHHGAEIEALGRGGVEVDFYELGLSLEPDEEQLDALTGPRTRMLFITHFLGFPRNAARWRAWCDERRLLLFEDAAHAMLARSDRAPVGSFGDAAVWCLFKSFPVPDGAALLLRRKHADPELAAARERAAVLRGHAQWCLQRVPVLASARAGGGGAREFDLAAEIALGEPSAPLAATTRLLPRVASASAADMRRANYRLLLDELGSQVLPPFDSLTPGAVPLGMPLRTGDKPRLLDRLEARGIDAVDFWCAPHPALDADAREFRTSARRRTSTVLLPVHQGLRARDLERIADAARSPATRRRPELTIERADSIDALRDEWSELAVRARNVFATPEWTEIWCRHLLGDRSLELIALRSATGRLVGVQPLYLHSERPLRILRIAGHGPGEDLGPVCAPEDRRRVARGLVRALAQTGGGLLVAEHVSAEAGWATLTGGHPVRSEASPAVLPGRGGWDGFLSARGGRLRKDLARLQRRLAEAGDVQFRAGPGDLDRDLDVLFALHGALFADHSSFLDHASFHREFAAVASDRGWLRMWFLEVDGRPVAAWYGFRFAGIAFDYQGGRDPEWDRYSVGKLLLAHAMRDAIDDGVEEYRLLRGAEEYKQRFATHDRGVETLVIGRGPVGGVAAAAAAVLPDRLASAAKRRLAA
jgi:dTDP-4-amino-4,6-dideoxygalactose transaminase/CelD/BcsL family acetyltransferase involved in cellulose biosynthesis